MFGGRLGGAAASRCARSASAADAPVGYKATDNRAMRTALVTEVGLHKAGAKMTHADAIYDITDWVLAPD